MKNKKPEIITDSQGGSTRNKKKNHASSPQFLIRARFCQSLENER